MTTVQTLLEPVRDYLLMQHERLRAAKPDPVTLLQSLAFHASRGTLAVVWNAALCRDAATPAGLAIAYQRKEADIRERGEEVFAWRGNDAQGDSVYLALVLATDRRAMRPLAGYFLERFPQWRGLKQWAHRRGRLVRVDGLLQRLSGAQGTARPTK